MAHILTHIRARLTLEAGLSLVEVIVAIVVVSVVALSTASLTISGIESAATQQRRQVAVAIASGALETVSALPVGDLYKGRYKADVEAAFLADAGVAGVAQTKPAWDPSAASTSTLARPVQTTQNGTKYLVTTLIGNCNQPMAGGDCTTATPPAGFSPLARAIVVVSWTAGATCDAGCSYVASTLIDRNADLEWVTDD